MGCGIFVCLKDILIIIITINYLFFSLHVKGWNNNKLNAEEVKDRIELVSDMIKTVQEDLPVNQDMAQFLKDNLFCAKANPEETEIGKKLAEVIIVSTFENS
jgi:site-specific recombinase